MPPTVVPVLSYRAWALGNEEFAFSKSYRGDPFTRLDRNLSGSGYEHGFRVKLLHALILHVHGNIGPNECVVSSRVNTWTRDDARSN